MYSWRISFAWGWMDESSIRPSYAQAPVRMGAMGQLFRRFFLVPKTRHFNAPQKGPRTEPRERLKHIASSFDQSSKRLIRCSANSTSIRQLGSKPVHNLELSRLIKRLSTSREAERIG
jgi:hypothetical protein